MPPSPSLPSVSALPHSPDATLTQTLDLLFEPSPQLHTLALPLLRSTTFPNYPTLITAIATQLTALAASPSPSHQATLSHILTAHPRLGQKSVDSAQSRTEQAGLQHGGEEERRALESLNREYEERFEGLRYVVFVNARPRSVIMQNMRFRIDRGDVAAERLEAINAMCDIACDRAGKLMLPSETQ